MKYVIQTKVLKDGYFTQPVYLEPFVHKNLYTLKPIQNAVSYLKNNPETQLIGLRIQDRLYTIIVITEDIIDQKYIFEEVF